MEKTLFFLAVLAMLCVSCSKDDEIPSHGDGLQNGREYVDLGLPSGTKWATMNIGAKAPEEYGDYFAWAETEGFNSGKTVFTEKTYKYYLYTKDHHGYTKYVYYKAGCAYDGFYDDKTELDPEDDVAKMKWGGSWRMPTKEEVEELLNNCECTWTSIKGVRGYKVSSRTNSHYIFLPAAGSYYDSYGGEGNSAFYLTSSCSGEIADALAIIWNTIDDPTISSGGWPRCAGASVRAVCK